MLGVEGFEDILDGVKNGRAGPDLSADELQDVVAGFKAHMGRRS